jgi:predicted AAA+ superfamily ATPase
MRKKIIKRDIEQKIVSAAKKVGVLSIMGPRQSGKTTLVRELFPQHEYYNLEDIGLREKIKLDPKSFLKNHTQGIILDEVQKYPELLSYIQVIIDDTFSPSKFVLTGSENLVLSEKVSQSLAGRVAIFQLLPLSISELKRANVLETNPFKQILTGFYPRIYSQRLHPKEVYPDYITTYVERDVRQVKNIGDLSNFQRFLQLLAGRIGQVLNLSSLANDVGVTYKTIDSWISLLETTYIAFRLQPYYQNLGKRIVKSPKIFFYDVGLVCYLLGIDSTKELSTHSAIGSIFENMIIADVKKQLFNAKATSQVYFWRDSDANEIDLIVKNGEKLFPIEIKLGGTFNTDYLKGIKVWQHASKNMLQSYLVYTGDSDRVLDTELKNWQQTDSFIEIIK